MLISYKNCDGLQKFINTAYVVIFCKEWTPSKIIGANIKMLWSDYFYKTRGTIQIPQTFQGSQNLWIQYLKSAFQHPVVSSGNRHDLRLRKIYVHDDPSINE